MKLQTISSLFCFFIFVFLQLTIYFLPSRVKELLVLNRLHPSLIALWTTHFTHFENFHIRNNLFFGSLALILLSFLLKKIKRENLFIKLFVLNIVLTPIFLSLAHIFLYKEGIRGFGSSGIVASFFGSLIFFLSIFLVEKVKEIEFRILGIYSSLLFLCILYFSTTYLNLHENWFIPLMGSTGYFLSILWSIRRKRRIKKIRTVLKLFLFLTIPYISVVSVSLCLFPLDPKGVAIGLHYCGMVVGLTYAYYLLLYSAPSKKIFK